MPYNFVPGSFHTGVTAKALRAIIDRKSTILHQRGHFELCENCRGQSCKAFIGLTIRAKMIVGGRPLPSQILSQSEWVGAKFEQ